jgi:transcriptional regulator GlxA family with amidase domain
VHRVQDAVSSSPQEAWSLVSMAALTHTTPRSLSRLFSQHVGTTPLAYLRGIRLALAQIALQAGGTVTAAAQAAGFQSDLQLRRAWRAAGCSGSPAGARAARALKVQP